MCVFSFLPLLKSSIFSIQSFSHTSLFELHRRFKYNWNQKRKEYEATVENIQISL